MSGPMEAKVHSDCRREFQRFKDWDQRRGPGIERMCENRCFDARLSHLSAPSTERWLARKHTERERERQRGKTRETKRQRLHVLCARILKPIRLVEFAVAAVHVHFVSPTPHVVSLLVSFPGPGSFSFSTSQVLPCRGAEVARMCLGLYMRSEYLPPPSCRHTAAQLH